MAILSLRQNISEELFLAGLREIRVIIARNNFRGINCVIISERRVCRLSAHECISSQSQTGRRVTRRRGMVLRTSQHFLQLEASIT